MIRIGYNIGDKKRQIQEYCRSNNISKVYFFTPEKFAFDFEFEGETVLYDEIILYKFFYRLLKEIDGRSLVVVNECLRTQNRSDLTFNCLRQFLNQTPHQIIFQYLPQIDGKEDFMTLLDFDTKTKFKMQGFKPSMLEGVDIHIKPVEIEFTTVEVQTSEKTKIEYQRERSKLFDSIGLRDPHTIPRNLYQIGGKEKLRAVLDGEKYVAGNNRFKIPSLFTYKESPTEKAIVFEFPHNFINFSDYLYTSQNSKITVLKSDLKVDGWYFDRYNEWAKRIEHGFSNLQQG
jgi:hypothetical protein